MAGGSEEDSAGLEEAVELDQISDLVRLHLAAQGSRSLPPNPRSRR